MVKDEIVLYIKKGSNIFIKFNLENNPNDTCGFLEIYEDNKLIYKDELYPYFPKS